jgi:molybdopterin molybdotransferase
VKKYDIGFELAVQLAMENIYPIGAETINIAMAVGRVLASPANAVVDSPTLDASLKDGYAVFSSDLVHASEKNPIKLEMIGYAAAGEPSDQTVRPGTVVRILSGAAVPAGATAVLADEFAMRDGTNVHALATAETGKNILPKGSDVRCGEMLGDTGQLLTPQLIGLLVAGGLCDIDVFRKPRIGLLATGTEILLPGTPMTPGKLYASNAALQQAWFQYMGFESAVAVSGDSEAAIADALVQMFASCDVVVTSGGAWKGDRDLVVKVLDGLGWKMLFHRVRMGPGKAVAMGFFDRKPVFCLPGGPASNEMAFIMIVFPAILKFSGFSHSPFIYLTGRLENDIFGQIDWTQFVQCEIVQTHPEIILRPGKMKSRLAAMSRTHAIAKIPEGIENISAGEQIPFICLNKELFAVPL